MSFMARLTGRGRPYTLRLVLTMVLVCTAAKVDGFRLSQGEQRTSMTSSMRCPLFAGLLCLYWLFMSESGRQEIDWNFAITVILLIVLMFA